MREFVRLSWFRRIYQSKVVTFLLRSWVLALLLGTVTFFLIRLNPDRYQFVLSDSSSFVPDPDLFRKYYLDLNSDGKTEDYSLSSISDSAFGLVVRNSEGIVIDQWNFRGRCFSGLLQPMYSDHDRNGKTEINTLTVNRNQLYLNIIEPYGPQKVIVKDRPIDTIWTKYGNPLAYLCPGKPADLNHDGSDEIIFSLSSGYARQPRKVYAYDVKGDSLWSSPYAGSFLSEVIPVDLDRDGKIELVGRCESPNNYMDDPIELPDKNSWLIILDEKLNYKVKPVIAGPVFSSAYHLQLPEKSRLSDFFVVSGYKDSVAIFNWYRLMPDYTLQEEVFPFNPQVTHSYSFMKPTYSSGGLFYNRYDKVLFINSKGKCFTSRSFSKRVIPVPVLNQSSGLKEFEYCLLVDGRTPKLSFFSLEGKELGSIKDVNYADLINISWASKIGGNHQLFLAGNKLFQWFEVRRNPWQYFRFLVWICLSAGFFGFLELLRFSQAHEIARREDLRRDMLEMQLKTVKDQMDPHFTFNALNGLSYLVMSGDTLKVNNFITHFSRLLRIHLNTADQAMIKLCHEIEFLENYMELQRIRFDDRVRLVVEIDPDVDTNMLVPKMVLQTHVENSLKHGLRPMIHGQSNKPGIISIFVFMKKDSTVIIIEDNGMGRGNGSAPAEESTGKGLQVLEQIYASVKLLYKMKITQEYEDLRDDNGNATGTRVKIVIN